MPWKILATALPVQEWSLCVTTNCLTSARSCDSISSLILSGTSTLENIKRWMRLKNTPIKLKIPKLSIIPFQGMSNYLKVPSSLLLRFDKAFSTADVVLSKYSFRKIFNLSLFIVSSFGMQSTLLSTRSWNINTHLVEF